VKCEVRKTAAGILHHLLETDAVLLRYQPIDLAHLCRIDGGNLPTVNGRKFVRW
jgi:hypothetical protein